MFVVKQATSEVHAPPSFAEEVRQQVHQLAKAVLPAGDEGTEEEPESAPEAPAASRGRGKAKAQAKTAAGKRQKVAKK